MLSLYTVKFGPVVDVTNLAVHTGAENFVSKKDVFLFDTVNLRWRGGATGRALDLRSTGRGF